MSSGKVNMSLDEIIKERRKTSGPRNFRKNSNFNRRGRNNWGRENKFRSNRDWRSSRYGAQRKGSFGNRRAFRRERNDQKEQTRLFINDLPKTVNNNDLREIFGTCGQLKRCGIHWDEMGYSKGTADVEYFKSEDAKKAVEEYKNAEIEGKPIKVALRFGQFRSNLKKKRSIGFRKRIGFRRKRINN